MLAIAASLGVAYAYFYQAGGWNQNTRYALVRSILEEGTLSIDATSTFEGRRVTGDIAHHAGHAFSDKAPGASFTAVLPVLVASMFVDAPSSRSGIATLSWVATLAASALPTVLAALAVFHLALVFECPPAAAAFASLVFGLATPAWVYATILYGHALAGACLVAAFAAAVALEENGSAGSDALLGLAVGAGGGWATVSEYPSAIPAAIVALYALSQAWPQGPSRIGRVAAGVGAGAMACAAVLAMHNASAFGSPWALGYTKEAGDFGGLKEGFLGITYPKPTVLYEILVGRFRGLFYYSPVLALAPLGLGLLVASPKWRRAGLVAAAIVAYHLLLNASYFYWDGGWTYGPRHLAPAIAFLALGLAPLWARAPRAGRVAMLVVALYSAGTTLVAVSTQPQPDNDYKAPYREFMWPAFAEGRLALNHQSFVEDARTRDRDPVSHSWNLGEKAGLDGHASLVPLFTAWIAIAMAWWWADASWRGGEAPAPSPVSNEKTAPPSRAGSAPTRSKRRKR